MKKIIFLAIPIIAAILFLQFRAVYTVKGIVLNEQGNAIAGALISEAGGFHKQATRQDGTFTINVAGRNTVLRITHAGYAQEKVAVTVPARQDSTYITVVLKPLSQPVSVNTNIPLKEEETKMEQKSMRVADGMADMGVTVTRAYTPPAVYTDKKMDWNRGRVNDTHFNTEGYDRIVENEFQNTKDNPLSTFSVDVDAASYSNVRRYINQGQLPPPDAVRIEEMVNYFKYEYAPPANGDPFAIYTEAAPAPWNAHHQIVMIGLQGKKIPTDKLPASNIVFLIDVSGSMQDEMKLPLVKSSMKMLVDQLRPQDKVSIVVYAGATGVVLKPTHGHEKNAIKLAIDQLEAGGSTAGGEGIRLAYKMANEQFIKEGNNRVVLCTDGDFNVGESSDAAMERLIEKERESGIYLTVLGYGMGNYKDSKMQKLADKGNGNHAYIDGMAEAKKVLVNEFGGTMFTIAKDVKLQVEFNPAVVQGYRLIGYENRMLAKEDFNDDKKDAGELGSGHTVTAMYEIIPVGEKTDELRTVDPLKYTPATIAASTATDELLTVKFRYKEPNGSVSKLIQQPLKNKLTAMDYASQNFRFAMSVAGFGLYLRDSKFKGDISLEKIISMARIAKGTDAEGYRAEFINLVELYASLNRPVSEHAYAPHGR